MYRDPGPDPSATADAVLNGLTAAQTAYLRGPANRTPDDAEAIAELDALAGVLRRALIELDHDRPLTDLAPYTLSGLVRQVLREIARLTAGHEAVTGRQARLALADWSGRAGQAAFAAVADLRRVLVTRLQARDAARLAAQAPPAAPQQAAAPTPRTNPEILAAELALALAQPAPQGTDPAVRAILVAGGRSYRGRNDGSGLLHLTYAVVSRRVDRLESWSVGNCAEVHALDMFVHDRGFTTEDEVVAAFRTAPVAYPDSWIVAMDARGRGSRSWVKRLPCENCRQWLAALAITPDTRGAVD